jgi:hemerythrin
MALINWDTSYSVNIAEIDRQHKKLVQIISAPTCGMLRS